MPKSLKYFLLLCFLAVFLLYAHYAERTNQTHKRNITTLQSELTEYKVRDSLSAVRTTALELSLKEYKVKNTEQYELIGQLQADKKGLQSVIAVQSRTITELKANLVPLVVTDTVTLLTDTIHCFEYKSKWLEAFGCISDTAISLSVISHDELVAVESLKRKRFIGIPLPIKLFGYRERELNVVSLNPSTVVDSISYQTIVR